MSELTVLRNSQPASQNGALVYIASLNTPSGQRTMYQALNRIADLAIPGSNIDNFPWSLLRYSEVAAIRAKLSAMFKPATVNKMLSALRSTIKSCWRLGQITSDEYMRTVDIGNVRGSTLPSGRQLSIGEIKAIMDVCSPRDAAIIAVLYGGGLRVGELVSLQFSDWDGEVLKVTGKGNKERTAHLRNGGSRAIEAWLDTRGTQDGYLFLSQTKSGIIKHGGMLSTQAVAFMLLRRGKEAGIDKFSPHDLRRTFVSHLLNAGASLNVVAGMAGHANVNTTSRYDMRGEEVKAKASELLHVPYDR